ncbi:MAG TPA: hypothetical protein VEI03_08505 [Stellaceae bacterium]|nr:hypothetical protein [Stellaceae bacterium]
MPLSKAETKQVTEGIERFYSELGRIEGGQYRAAEILSRAGEETGFHIYADLLGELAKSSFDDPLDSLMSLDDQPERIAVQALGHKSIGRYVLMAFHKRICGDPSKAKQVRKAIAEAVSQGVKITTPTVDHLGHGAATVLAVTIATVFSGPIAVAIAPLIGGIALLLIQSGLDGFCAWAAAEYISKAPSGKLTTSENSKPQKKRARSRSAASRRSTVLPRK